MIIELKRFKKGKIYRAHASCPYIGCFEEPVYAYSTENGKADFLNYGEEKDWDFRMKESVSEAWYDTDEIEEFEYDNITELFNANPNHAVTIAKYVEKKYKISAVCKCPNCEEMKLADEFEYDEGSLKGLGGVASMHTDWYCQECMLSNRCEYCGHLVLGTDDELDSEGKCSDCRLEECKFCMEDKNPLYFDIHGVCEDCQNNEIYMEQLDMYTRMKKQIEYEHKHQLRFEGMKLSPIPPFIPVPEKEYINV